MPNPRTQGRNGPVRKLQLPSELEVALPKQIAPSSRNGVRRRIHVSYTMFTIHVPNGSIPARFRDEATRCRGTRGNKQKPEREDAVGQGPRRQCGNGQCRNDPVGGRARPSSGAVSQDPRKQQGNDGDRVPRISLSRAHSTPERCDLGWACKTVVH